MATPNELKIQALDAMKAPPGSVGNVGSQVTAMRMASQQASKTGQPLNMAQVGQAVTQQAGEKLVGQAQQAAGTEVAVGQAKLQEQQQSVEADLFRREEAMKQTVHGQEMELKRLSSSLAQQLHEDTTQFRRDDLGRAYLNEKQLSDYAVLHAKNQEELEQFAQVQGQLHEQRMQLLKVSYAQIEQALKQTTDRLMQDERIQFDAEQQKELQQQQLYLANAKRALQEKMAQQQREAAQAAAGWGILTSAMQGAAAGAPGGIWGVVGGAVVGAGVGTAGYMAAK